MVNELIDVVCGRPVAATSQHHHVRGGALYCFCSEQCRNLFMRDASAFVSHGAASRGPGEDTGAVSTATSVDAAESIARLRMAYRLRHGSPPDAVEPDDSIAARRDRVYIAPAGGSRSEKSEPPTRSSDGRGHTVAQFRAVSGVADGGAAAANVASFRPADPVPPHGHGVGGATGTQADAPAATGFARAVLGIVPTPLLAWRERRFAERICRELLKLHALVSSRQPNLTGRDLYRQIVGVRIGDDAAAVDAAAVDAVLDGAERSFAQWPADRELRFCDIVNYLAATEFLAAHRGSRWIHADMKHIVASRIPREL